MKEINERLNRDFTHTEENERILEAYDRICRGETEPEQLDEAKVDWDAFYKASKDTSGGKAFADYEKKYSGITYQAPHVQDALKKAKNLKDFKMMISRFEKKAKMAK